jgi:S-adenosylmethionine:tRNA ribosyltransferase-isomerase
VTDAALLDYELPRERIAQAPVEPRDAARLLILDRAPGSGRELEECRFGAIADRIGPDDLLVVNDTRVLRARLRGHKASGGRIEALLLERVGLAGWRALVRSNARLRTGLELVFGGPQGWQARLASLEPGGSCVLEFVAAAEPDRPVELVPDDIGEMPLPPYIERTAERKADHEDYQSVFAREPGAVAAPTASLHFTPELAARLPLATLTLHVGPGTFRPLRSERVEDHVIEGERYDVPAETAAAIARTKQRGGRVIAVGTTVVRALETSGGRAGPGTSELLITPGHEFRVVDSIVTNFHLPRTSLLALVMAFGGVEPVRRAYAHAVAHGFRFYSYGDAMWLR